MSSGILLRIKGIQNQKHCMSFFLPHMQYKQLNVRLTEYFSIIRIFRIIFLDFQSKDVVLELFSAHETLALETCLLESFEWKTHSRTLRLPGLRI